MNPRQIKFKILLMMVVGSAVWNGCSKPVATPMAKLLVKSEPTPFFDWCVSEKFGVRSPSSTSWNNSVKNILSGNIGTAESRAWTPCKTEEEAKHFLGLATAELRRVAAEKDCTLLDSDDSESPQENESVLKYQAGRNYGMIKGHYKLNDTEESGETVKAYFVEFKVTEEIREP